MNKAASRDQADFYLTIIGGSQGASIFSQTMPQLLSLLPSDINQKLVLTQQTRKEDIKQVKAIYQKLPLKQFTIAPFFSDMGTILANSDLIISRAGSSSLA